MKQRLYKYHNLPLYFWLNPEDVASYNLFYKNPVTIPSVITFKDFEKAVKVITKVYGRVLSAQSRGLVPEGLMTNRSEPLTLAY